MSNCTSNDDGSFWGKNGKYGTESPEPIADRRTRTRSRKPAKKVLQYVPVTKVRIPSGISSFVTVTARSIGCDAVYILLPLLSALASAIGNSRCLRLKHDYFAPAALWTMIIGESGSQKTPAFRAVMKPLQTIQEKYFDQHAIELKQYQSDLENYKLNRKQRKAGNTCIITKPEPPIQQRVMVTDITIEAMGVRLQENPRGLLVHRDELAGWLGSFGQYSGGKTADSTHWLSMYNGTPLIVDRKTGDQRTIFVRHPLVSITGGIQPKILQRALGEENFDNGMAARFLMAAPPCIPSDWMEADTDDENQDRIQRLFEFLFSLEAEIDENGKQSPKVIQLSDEAKELWKQYHDKTEREIHERHGHIRAAWSKLKEIPARLSIVFHYCRWFSGELLDSKDVIDAETMTMAIDLAEWCKHETTRVYSLLGESATDRMRRELIHWIESKGGEVTARDVSRGLKRFRDGTCDPDKELQALVDDGYGEWVNTSPSSTGGRPTRVFRLHSVVACDSDKTC